MPDLDTVDNLSNLGYTKRVADIVERLRLERYQSSVKVVSPEFGGMWKFKFFITGKQRMLPFSITLSMLDGYNDDQMVKIIMRKLEAEKIAPFDKQPYKKSGFMPKPPPKDLGLHPTKRLDGLIDLQQVVRMTCCKIGQQHKVGDITYWVSNLQDGIIHLNDKHKWNREQIADWLESQDVDIVIGKD